MTPKMMFTKPVYTDMKTVVKASVDTNLPLNYGYVSLSQIYFGSRNRHFVLHAGVKLEAGSTIKLGDTGWVVLMSVYPLWQGFTVVSQNSKIYQKF